MIYAGNNEYRSAKLLWNTAASCIGVGDSSTYKVTLSTSDLCRLIMPRMAQQQALYTKHDVT